MADLEATIAGALASAREEGTIDDGTPPVVEETTEESTEETTVEDKSDKSSTESGKEESEETKDDETTMDDKGKVKKIPKTEVTKDKKVTKEEKVEISEDDDDDGKKHLVNNMLPYKRHVKIADNREKKAFAKVAESLGLSEFSDWRKVTPESFTNALGTLNTEIKELREEVKDFNLVKPVMLKDPDEFMARLVRINPDYANFKRVKDGKTTEEVVDDDDPDPEEDVEIDLGNGKKGKTWSRAAYDKIRAKDRARAKKEALKEARAEIEARLSPIEKERKAKEDLETDLTARKQHINKVVARMQKKHGWADNETEIREAVLKGKFKDLPFEDAVEAAYEEIVIGKLVSARKKVEEEDDEKVTSTSLSSAAGKKKIEEIEGAEEGDDRTTTAVRKALSAAKRKGIIK